MFKILCIKSVQRKPNEKENFSKDIKYNVFDIDTDYEDSTSLQLEVLNNQNIPHIIACILGNIKDVQDADWYKDNFFKEHFLILN